MPLAVLSTGFVQMFDLRSACWKSGWLKSMPESITATTMSRLPVNPRAQASPACEPYWLTGVVASPYSPQSEPLVYEGSSETSSG
jgi:hypothetical protein